MVGEWLQERLRAFGRSQLIGLAAAAALLVGGAGLWYVRSLPRPVTIQAEVQSSAGQPPGGAAAPAPTAAPVIVDVAGWVRLPGVYQFRQGDRVVDAISRAGGPRKGADLTSLNLAALLTDGEQILVGRAGAAASPGSSSSGAGTGPAGSEALVNLNTATLDELETLPGIGEVLGQRIIDYREEHGPFQTVEDLLDVSGIGDSRLADIKPKVTV